MDNLPLAILPWGLGLALFAALSVTCSVLRFLDSRRHRRKVERRLEKLTRFESCRNYHGLTWPQTRTRPWQRRVR